MKDFKTHSKQKIDTFTFKPLEESDISMLCEWLNKPHVKEWWNDELTTEQIQAKYKERIGLTLAPGFIIYLNEKAIGFIQYWHAHQTNSTVGIDLFIGEEDYINCGYGTHIVFGFVKKLFKTPTIKKIIADPDPRNHRAIRCYEKAGFKLVGQTIALGGLSYSMEITR